MNACPNTRFFCTSNFSLAQQYFFRVGEIGDEALPSLGRGIFIQAGFVSDAALFPWSRTGNYITEMDSFVIAFFLKSRL